MSIQQVNVLNFLLIACMPISKLEIVLSVNKVSTLILLEYVLDPLPLIIVKLLTLQPRQSVSYVSMDTILKAMDVNKYLHCVGSIMYKLVNASPARILIFFQKMVSAKTITAKHMMEMYVSTANMGILIIKHNPFVSLMIHTVRKRQVEVVLYARMVITSTLKEDARYFLLIARQLLQMVIVLFVQKDTPLQ